jgi:CheY-like chemotaxis protein
MSIKHALVVDDSKSAQIALKKQLEQHDLMVALAASGEEALEFLEHQSVDVIFMDHTMPGMDGLQALAAIKRNPRTAMIPVMMYTAKEGEVYVGQARALGGIGVLPKNVQPHVLFDMLLQLGLVKDKRAGATPDADTPRRRATDAPGDRESSVEPPAGIALEAVVNRIMEDQAALRAEFRNTRAGLARDVAAEVIEAQRTVLAATEEAALAPPAPRTPVMWIALTALFAATTLIFAFRASDGGASNDARPASVSGDDAAQEQLGRLNAMLRAEQTQAQARYFKAIDALQWAVNQHAGFPFDELPFDDTRAEDVRQLLERLVALNFQGRVRIESHLGEFCLVSDETGGYRLAEPDLPVEACMFMGHPQDNSPSVSDRQSVGFAEFFRSSPLVNQSGIVVELVAHDRARSLTQVPFPPDVSRAGDWNRIAERNNRLEFSLIPTGGRSHAVGR